MSEESDNIRQRREKAVAEFDQRTKQIVDLVKENGKPKLRINPFVNNLTQEKLDELISVVEKALATTVMPEDYGLYNILDHLRNYDLASPSTDEAGFDTPGFAFAVSEMNEALRYLHYGSDQKALDYLVYRYKVKKFANKLDVSGFIPVLHLESATNCNLICTMCYQADQRLRDTIKTQKIKTMPWDLFTKVVDDAFAHGCRAVVFAGRGEPTLNPRFTAMLKYCHDKGFLHLKLNTNMTQMTETMAREWLSMNAFLTIVFSVDAGDKKVFEEIRVGAKFDEVKGNVGMFNRIRRDEFPNSPVRTRVNMVLFREDQDREEARKLWEPLVDEFSARTANAEQAGGTYLDNPDGSPRNVAPGQVCLAPFTRIYVWADGKVNPCENDYLSWLQLGDANTESLHDIWVGPKMRALRLTFVTGKKNCLRPCNNCSAK